MGSISEHSLLSKYVTIRLSEIEGAGKEGIGMGATGELVHRETHCYKAEVRPSCLGHQSRISSSGCISWV